MTGYCQSGKELTNKSVQSLRKACSHLVKPVSGLLSETETPDDIANIIDTMGCDKRTSDESRKKLRDALKAMDQKKPKTIENAIRKRWKLRELNITEFDSDSERDEEEKRKMHSDNQEFI